MLLQPSKYKYKKQFKGRVRITNATSGNYLHCGVCIYGDYGNYGLMSLESARITSRQIEAARKAAIKNIKGIGNLWIRIFPNIPVTKKPLEVRMGKGKGSVEFYVFRVCPGKILFECFGISKKIVNQIFKLATNKLPVKCKVVELLSNGLTV